MQPVSKRVRGDGGIDLHLLEWSAQGVPLLLLHGFGNEAHIWDDFAPTVAPFYRTLALDHRGHGDSAWDAQGRYDHDSLVRDVEAVTDALGIQRLVLVAHSLGGRVATLFAGRHPERMAGLVLVDIGPELDPRGTTRIKMEIESNREPSFGSVDEFARLLSLNYPAAQPHALQRMARHGLRKLENGRFAPKLDPALRGAARGQPARTSSEEDLTRAQWEALAKIPCPTLVVRGAASDVLSADVAERMAHEVLPKGSLAVVARAGHSVMTDNPDGFRDAVAAFVLGEG
ncbi:MAG TPA: alpha/beta hydrolase [Myxococcota bacterium]|jgi:pimeloyl-ACP methyl ester carboxylesterase